MSSSNAADLLQSSEDPKYASCTDDLQHEQAVAEDVRENREEQVAWRDYTPHVQYSPNHHLRNPMFRRALQFLEESKQLWVHQG